MSRLSVSRRTALGGVGAGTIAWALSGCSIDLSALGGKDSRTPAQKAAALDPDALIVSQLAGALEVSLDLSERTRAAFPGLDPRLKPLRTAERAHLAVLRKAVTAGRIPTVTTTPVPVAGTRPVALAAALADADRLRTAYVAAAEKATSGGFAQLLAAMGASISQHLGTPA